MDDLTATCETSGLLDINTTAEILLKFSGFRTGFQSRFASKGLTIDNSSIFKSILILFINSSLHFLMNLHVGEGY